MSLVDNIKQSLNRSSLSSRVKSSLGSPSIPSSFTPFVLQNKDFKLSEPLDFYRQGVVKAKQEKEQEKLTKARTFFPELTPKVEVKQSLSERIKNSVASNLIKSSVEKIKGIPEFIKEIPEIARQGREGERPLPDPKEFDLTRIVTKSTPLIYFQKLRDLTGISEQEFQQEIKKRADESSEFKIALRNLQIGNTTGEQKQVISENLSNLLFSTVSPTGVGRFFATDAQRKAAIELDKFIVGAEPTTNKTLNIASQQLLSKYTKEQLGSAVSLVNKEVALNAAKQGTDQFVKLIESNIPKSLPTIKPQEAIIEGKLPESSKVTPKLESDFKIEKNKLVELWGKEGDLNIGGKDYSVHKMSYGDYFLEPKGKELGETEGFAKGTLWLEKVDGKDLYKLSDDSLESVAKVTLTPGKTVTNPLIQEAKKYKSADEFVKAQGKPVYHGSKTTTELKLEKPMSGMYKPEVYKQKGINIQPSISLSDNGEIAKKFAVGGGKVNEIYATPKKTLDLTKESVEAKKYIDINNVIKDKHLNPDFYTTTDGYKFLKENGYDSIRIKARNELGGGNDTELRIFDPSIIKTKSQLTDIWNKAQEKPAIPITTKKPPKKLSGKEQLKAREEAKEFRQEVQLERQNAIIEKESLQFYDQELEDQYQRFKSLRGKNAEDVEQLKSKNKNLAPKKIDNILYSQEQTGDEIFDMFKDRFEKEKAPLPVLPVVPKETKAIVAEKAKQTIRTAKEILDKRRSFIRAVQKQFGLSDGDLKSLTRKDIRLMNNIEFKTFLDDLRIRSEKLAEKNLAKLSLTQQITEKELNIEPLRKYMKLPTIGNMTTAQLRDFDEALRPFDKGDIFLSQRKLETIERTELEGVKTYQEARKRLQQKLGLTNKEMSRVGNVSEFDRFRSDTALAERDPYFRMMVEETAKLKMIRDVEFLDIEKKVLDLAKDLKTGVVGKVIPQQKNIVKWFEAKDKSNIQVTPAEEKIIKFMQNEWSNARDYLIKINAISKGINEDNYFTHVRRGIMEAVKEDGVIKVWKEIFDQYKLEEQAFNILDRETGDILALDKFFRFALHRTGALKPSENVVRAFIDYMRIFKKKQALDEIVPLIDIYSYALTPKGTTKEGLLLHGNLNRFTKEWLNSKKGRRITLMAKQGGKFDWALKGARTFTTLLDIGLNLPVSVATQVGEQVITYQLLGKWKFSVAKYRSLTPKGRRIRKKYSNFIGKNPWKELIEPARNIGDRLSEGIFVLFRDANIRRNRNFLLASMTKEEWATETLSPERLAHLRTEMGRFGMIEDAKSIIGATPEAGIFTQYKTWALPIMRTLSADAIELSRLLRGKKPSKRALLDFYRLLEIGAVILLVKQFIAVDEDDESIIGQLKNRAYQELTTLYQAPGVMLSVPRLITFLDQFNKNLLSLIKLEQYEQSKFGEYEEGDLKGLRGLTEQLTPRAIKQFDKEQQETLKDIAIEIQEDVDSGELSIEAAKQKLDNEIKKLETKEKNKRFKLSSKEYAIDLKNRIENKEISVEEAKEEFADYVDKNNEKIQEDFNKVDEPNFIDKITMLAKSMGTDPVTAFIVIFSKERIRKLENGTIIVERISVEESQAIKKDRGASKDMILDHTVPLQLGGTNSQNNLKLVDIEEWEQYTLIENYLGQKLRQGLIKEGEARQLILDYKSGKITENNIIK